MNSSVPLLRRVALLGACAVLLLTPALLNGFPLVFSDTGVYVACALKLSVPADHPVFYSLFLRAAQVGRSLWWPALVQAAGLSALLCFAVSVIRPATRARQTLALVALLAATTGVPWICGQIIADVFTPCLALCAYLLIFHRSALSRGQTWGLSALFAFSCVAHDSNILIISLTLGLLALGAGMRRTLVLPAGLVGLTLLAVPTTNKLISGEFYFEKAGPVLIMNRLVQSRIADRLLDEHCAERNYALCAYKDVLKGMTGEGYLWSPVPLEAIGGWESSGSVTWPVIIDAGAYYPFANLASIMNNFVRQFFSFDVLEVTAPYGSDSYIHRVIQESLPRAFADFHDSRQQRGDLQVWARRLRPLHRLAGIGSLLAAWVFLLSLGPRLPRAAKTCIGFMLLFAAVNALICGSNSVSDRFQARVLWLVTFAVGLAALDMIPPRGKSVAAWNEPSGSLDRRLPAAFAATLAAFFVLVALTLRALSGRYVMTAPSPFWEKPVAAWPRPEITRLKLPLSTFGDASGLGVGVKLRAKTKAGREFIGTVVAIGPDAATMESSWEEVRWSNASPGGEAEFVNIPASMLARQGLQLGARVEVGTAHGRTLRGTVVVIGDREITLKLDGR